MLYWRDNRGKWPLARKPDRRWWHHHTSLKFFWTHPWAAGIITQVRLSDLDFFGEVIYRTYTLIKSVNLYISFLQSTILFTLNDWCLFYDYFSAILISITLSLFHIRYYSILLWTIVCFCIWRSIWLDLVERETFLFHLLIYQ